ncbi:site-specific integrase [Vibrio sp. S11_S32]|uniref:site-specific integrase n=1 Tax=Vibrio sp. S11_S32 TaxID=2720225 RepID=UPI0016802D55|nr:site-specific integrase [Vibrio sp. S11_S32]MBD1577400.1 site-specific integrase [Vibrio sp. S11_S32]
MSILHHISRKNRQRNSGGKYPAALDNAVTLAIFLMKLGHKKNSQPGIMFAGLFLWLTREMSSIESAQDIPDFYRVSTAAPCTKNAFRINKANGVSWCEYTLCHHKNIQAKEQHYVWQPVPTAFNALMLAFIKKKRYFNALQSSTNTSSYFLSRPEKAALFDILSEIKWKTPAALSAYPRVRKDRFFNYFFHCVQADNHLGAIVRMTLLPSNRHHHQSAYSYQRLDSDQIRYKIFEAHNRYLTALICAMRDAELVDKIKSPTIKETISLFTTIPKFPNHLSQFGRILQHQLVSAKKSGNVEITAPIHIGSRRYVDETDVTAFFKRLFTHIKKNAPIQSATKDQWIAHYNLATYRIAFLFIVLTGVRPNHSISIPAHRNFGNHTVFVSDKGRLRMLSLNPYLQQEIARYLQYQQFVLSLTPEKFPHDDLWFCLTPEGVPYSLSNRLLRHFMHDLWPGIVPYQLRHFFAQSATNSDLSIQLGDQDVDRLMGHSNLGEHLGSDDVFAPTHARMQQHLHSLSGRLGLQEMDYGQ